MTDPLTRDSAHQIRRNRKKMRVMRSQPWSEN